jgi:hypothetical protein
MVIFMAGFPKSGKTFVLDLILSKLKKDVFVVCPVDFRQDDYDESNEEKRRDIDLAAWEASLDLLWEEVCGSDDSNIIVYDTCCASLGKMSPYFKGIRKKGHVIVYLFVKSSWEKCKERAEAWLPKEVVNLYKDKFKYSIPGLCELSDHVVIVENNSDDVPDVSKIMKLVS